MKNGKRDENGRFACGNAGGPGRPRGFRPPNEQTLFEVWEMAEKLTDAADKIYERIRWPEARRLAELAEAVADRARDELEGKLDE